LAREDFPGELGFTAPRVFFAKRLSGSVVDACVSLERRSPWKFTVELPRARDGVTP
jgi:hypothetical protein